MKKVFWGGLALLAAVPAAAQDAPDMMQFFDPNGDGKVTLEEYTAAMDGAWGFFSQGADKVKVADLQPMAKPAFTGVTPAADGTVDKPAFLAVVPAKFKAADKNGDGALTKEELMASMGPPPAQ